MIFENIILNIIINFLAKNSKDIIIYISYYYNKEENISKNYLKL